MSADCRHRNQAGLRLPESFLHGIQAETRGEPDGILIKTWSYCKNLMMACNNSISIILLYY